MHVLVAALALVASHPTLHVDVGPPFTVRGTGFHGAEKVRVRVTVLRAATRSVRTTPRGTFVVRFRGVRVGLCYGYTVSATGNRGDHVVLALRSACVPGP